LLGEHCQIQGARFQRTPNTVAGIKSPVLHKLIQSDFFTNIEEHSSEGPIQAATNIFLRPDKTFSSYELEFNSIF
jgi:hypothetical protein